MEVFVPVQWFLFSILLLVWFYIACRLGASGIARSWFEEEKRKRNERLKKGEKNYETKDK